MKNFVINLTALPTQCEGFNVPSRLALFTLTLALLLLASCAPLRPDLGPPVSSDFADSLMQDWQDKSSHIKSIQGLATVNLKAPLNNINATQVVLAELPDRLRAETLSPFGVPIILLVANGDKMGVLLTAQNLYYQGAATPENLGTFVNLPLELTDLVGVLLYQPPVLETSNNEAFKLNEGGWLLIRRTALQRQELVFNALRQLVEVSYFKDNDLVVKIHYANFSDTENHYPTLLTLEIPDKYATVSLKFSDVETNGQLRSELFKIEPPAKARIVYLPD
jgi:outer membrane lipoprotein-sorting protein